MTSLVLLDRPEYLNIPYFEMAVPSSRENRFARLNLNSLPKMVGRRCAAWLTEHRDKIDLISTRNYLHPKTAVYAHWLAFRDPALPESFLAVWPRYNSEEQIENLRTERERLAATIDRRLTTGSFDLSRLPEQDRLAVARRYIELHEKLCELDRHIRDLELAAEFAEQWAKQV
jgi:hypothetical protein